MPETEEISEVAAVCSKCEGVLDTTGYPKWCKKCRAKNQREYNATVKEMSETRGYAAGFAAGAEAMKKSVIQQLSQLGNGRFPGLQIAGWVRNLRNPSHTEG